MKKLLSILLALVLFLPAAAVAEEDLSAMSFYDLRVLREKVGQEIASRPEWEDVMASTGMETMSFYELVALREYIGMVLTNRAEWKEVTVPIGVWQVGVDIPEGHWTVTAAPGLYAGFTVGTALDALGQDIDVPASQVYYSEILLSQGASYASEFGNRSALDIVLRPGYYVVVTYGPVVFTPFIGKPSLGF